MYFADGTDFVHFRELPGHVLNRLREEEIRHPHSHTVFFGGEDLHQLVESTICGDAPPFRILEGGNISVLPAHGGRPFPSKGVRESGLIPARKGAYKAPAI